MELDKVFQELRKLMQPFAATLDYKSDEPGNLYIDTIHIMKNKKPLFFGAVQTKKNYVNYRLMPVYVNPSLLDFASSELRKCMQGKSCFNFKSVNKVLFEELGTLTKVGYQLFRDEGYVRD